MLIQFLIWLPTIISACLAVAIFMGQTYLKSSIEGSVKASFEKELEGIRSELRTKEGAIAQLQAAVLASRSGRRTLYDQRRITAVENIWKSVVRMAHFKNYAKTLALIDYDEASKRTVKDQRMREFFGMFVQDNPTLSEDHKNVDFERPFITPLAWALFAAYRSVIVNAVLMLRMLEHGIDEPRDLLKKGHMQDVLLAILPDKSAQITTGKPESYSDFLDDIEALLLVELESMLSGEKQDIMDAHQTKAIMDALREDANPDPGQPTILDYKSI